jgi:XTP/dITP diphosphohydrolase
MSAGPPRLLVATTNRNKLREIRALLAGSPVELLSLDDLPPVAEPEETGATFEENARLKARYYAAHSGMLTAAEDSGLAIDALHGEPGVYSARYLGPDATYPERFADIYRRLAEVPDQARSARFVCALAVADGERIRFETTGVVDGQIAPSARGTAGFGYDPIFHYPPFGRTLAEVGEDQKLAIAHRGVAFRALADWLKRGG